MHHLQTPQNLTNLYESSSQKRPWQQAERLVQGGRREIFWPVGWRHGCH
jgi:hypothetical protein